MNQPATTENFYKILECDPDANPQTIDFLFRYLIKLAETGGSAEINEDRVVQLTEAYEVLRDPDKRAEYDQQRQSEFAASREETTGLPSTETENEMPNASQDRQKSLKILQVLWLRRRKDARNPGLAPSSIAKQTELSEQETDFQIWYLTQSGWAQREESGVVSITAAGVDQCAAAETC